MFIPFPNFSNHDFDLEGNARVSGRSYMACLAGLPVFTRINQWWIVRV